MSFDKKTNPGARLAEVAHAKINLALHITGQRYDGYHLLDSLVGFTDFGDRLTIAPGEDGPDLVQLDITGPFASDLLSDDAKGQDDNLVVRAAMTLADKYQKSGFKCTNVRIILEKNLPVASGIGGGSADAAAALLLLQQVWENDHVPDLLAIAEKLGADVPMCLNTRPKRIRGIGELICNYDLPVSLPVVLVNPLIPLSTPTVFGALADKNNSPIASVNNFANSQSGDRRDEGNIALLDNAIEILSPLRNDLQIPAISLVPEIEDVVLSLERQPGCRLARMSGSGATCFGIFSNSMLADKALIGIRQHYPHWWSVACGILPGPADGLQ